MHRKLIIFVFSLIIVSCKEKAPVSKEIARVGNEVLTERELETALGSERFQNKFKEEFIRQWIQTEVLYQKSVKSKITKDSLYNNIVTQSKKELASAFLLQKVVKDSNIVITPTDLRKYYYNHKDEFSLPFDAYVLNVINFGDENEAIKFRQLLLSSGWKDNLKHLSEFKSVSGHSEKKLVYKNEIQPKSLLRIVEQLRKNTISLVIETEPGNFTVVQLINKFNKGDVPKLTYITDQVEERLKIIRTKQIIKNYISKLYEEFQVHITRD